MANDSSRDERKLMPGLAPPPALRRPAPAAHQRYMSNQLEREYAALVEELDALADDIRNARKVSRQPLHGPGGSHAPRREPPRPPHGEPATLPDGAHILIRPIEAGDAPQLDERFKELDAGSRYQRFLTPIEYLTPHQLDYLTHVDHENHEALVAIDAATGDGVGVARFVRDGRDHTCADFAIVVAAAWHGRGVGKLLAERLAARARAVGVKSFTARMLAGNRVARRLVEQIGEPIREQEDGAAIVLTARLRTRTQPR